MACRQIFTQKLIFRHHTRTPLPDSVWKGPCVAKICVESYFTLRSLPSHSFSLSFNFMILPVAVFDRSQKIISLWALKQAILFLQNSMIFSLLSSNLPYSFVLPLTARLSSAITEPLQRLMENFEYASNGDFNQKMDHFVPEENWNEDS